jgi:hypothetical protein
MLLTPRACGATPPVLHDQLQGEGKSTLAALRSPAHSSDAAAAALAGLVQRFQAEQQQFCSELAAGTPQPGGTPPNDTYFVHTVAMEHGGVQSSVAMYALSGEDIVSHDIQTKGSWELAETREVLDRLQEWRDVRARAGWVSHPALSIPLEVSRALRPPPPPHTHTHTPHDAPTRPIH